MSETGDGLDHLRIPFEKIKFGNKLETQGYGTVFEGEFDDQIVALKQLNITNLANIKPKLLAEISTISRFRQHPNLVALLGFCDEKINEIILVYEYVASGNLADKMRKRLNTIQRFEICLGAARGLDYLHTGVENHSIVHGNIKPSKILLNSVTNSVTKSLKFEAKVSSFGLSKIVPGKAQALESNEVEKLTKESDVYAFGVVLLEVLCGVLELVDTDDYQERHVTELVPKKMAQNKLQKVVHFDIRKEIKPEALETYAKIACQCVVDDPDARPQMARVVEELEKALRLQGGEVTYVQLRASENIAEGMDETIVEEGLKGDGSEEDEKDLTVGEKSVDAGEVNGEEVNVIETTSESSNGEKNTESVPSETQIEDAKDENSINDQVIERELLHDLKSEKESNIMVENEAVAQNEMSTIDRETTEETIDNFDYNKESNIKEDEISIEVTSTSESNGDTSTLINQEEDDIILKSDIEDELEHLRIPFEKIKFGQKIDVRGYGTLFEGEFDSQQVALKRLNITNLGNIKPKLLSAILTISKFRKHPNLVALIGFCDESDKEIILVYEYVSGGNLADKMSKHLTTIQRLQICLGAARGVEYLHGGDESVDSKPVIIHGDLKLSKILLNPDSNSSNFDAKVSGFGLPKVFPGHVEISPKSMDPVHAATGKLTKESDVYTFGVLLLEVLCGVPELVDTDDYQERHVTELVPKRLEQNTLRKIVHFDIRNEITSESLETYAKIACRCVMKNPEERPTMSEVVVELEKALKLQGGEVTDVQIIGRNNGNGLAEVPGGEGDHEGDDNGEMISSDLTEEESKVVKETVNDTNLESEDLKSHIENAKNENSNDHQATEREIIDLKFEKESNITVENEEEVHKEISTIDPETAEEAIDDIDSIKESNIIEENKEDDKSIEVTTTSEPNNGDTSTSTNQDVDESNILKSGIEDGLEHLRIPFEKIKFGQKIDVRGYGTLFEGEFDNQQVALKRLNITNLGNIKPKLLSAILTISKFRKHPNLVALIGVCDENDKEIIIVYEYVSGGNLADNMSKHLTTIQRLQICLGAARGVEYLHDGDESVDSKPVIIHGDLKLSKILLNPDSNSSNFDAKVSGFGLPKVFPGHVEISPKMFPGQVEIGPRSMDPVHAATGKLTKESDVYTFGVLLLEVLCGVPELVDTDDYQERHVTELVPKRLEQNMLRKIVHFDIRNEITSESLETYAKIACRCVMKNPEERPTMSEVVVELEKALRLQGGEVTDVQITGSNNGNGLAEVPGGEGDNEGDDNGETISSDITEEELKVVKETVDDTNLESEHVESHIENAKNENSNDHQATEREIITDLESEKESNIMVENEEVVHKEISTIDPETIEEAIDNIDSNKESNIIEENQEDDESIEVTTTSESNNGDTSTSTNQEVDESSILKSGIEDGLEHLRIRFEKIKFSRKIDVRGYGTLFEGEFNNQQVVLKRLNITNLGNIKPKLLSAILTIYKFRKHPNLVALIGFCDENDKEIILVYEYVSGGNLADNMSKHLTTIQRLQICLGAARGVEYLHNGVESVDSIPGIIHGDLKLSKILLNPDSNSSNFDAKVSGFGLPKVFPGHVEISPRSMDPVHAATGKLTKESDVYTFGVLLLEVLCGVPELVDTDDYQERHVTELVPKRLEQNTLRKIVYFDIRNEITSESLETYAKIACRCVMKNPDERPTMSEVVVELEKALRLQGREVNDVQILGDSNDNGLAEVPVGEGDHEGDDNGETISSDIIMEESKVVEETIDDTNLCESKDAECVPEDAETKNGDVLNDPESTEVGVELKSNEELKIGVEDDVGNESEIITPPSVSDNGDDSNSATVHAEKESDDTDNKNVSESASEIAVDLKSNDESKINVENEVNNECKQEPPQDEKSEHDEATKDKGNGLMMNTHNPHDKEIMEEEEQNSAVPDGDAKSGLLNPEKPELVVNIRGDISNSVTQTKESESKRSNSTCSNSSNGDDTTPSDLLLPKTPDKVTKTSEGSISCCSCSWWRYICSRMTGQCSSKRD